MTQPDIPAFEDLRDDLSAARPSAHDNVRTVRWVGTEKTLAYSRDQDGGLEIFLVGPPLAASDPSVRERLVHNAWLTTRDDALNANRIRLPSGSHFDAAAAAILIELLDHGYAVDSARAFQRTEPLIALVLGQARAENAVVTGLAGELLTLVALLRAPGAPAPETLLEAWQGWERSSRDFQLGAVGVEIKTSTTGAGRHHIQGWYQVEPGVAADGTVETHLYLLSLGIQWLPENANGHSIEGLVAEVMAHVPVHQHGPFLDAVRTYGGHRLEIDDSGTAAQQALRRPFVSTYERLYDMSDERVLVPRSADLSAFGHVVMDSVRFEVQLPERVRGDRNPVTGMKAATAAILESAAL